jgi:two-component system chemotaxis response regulator CheY
VYEAPSGTAALEVLRTRRVDVVLTDLHMPGMGGVELTRRMQADPAMRPIPVVVVSAEPSAARLQELRADGVRGVVRKPFTPEQVRDAVRGVLEVGNG